MSIEVFHRRRMALLNDVVLPDYSGYGITRDFALQKTLQSNPAQDYFISITSSGGVIYYVFKDADGLFSLNSKISITTTPSSTTIANLIAANPSTLFYVENYYCNISGLSLSREGISALPSVIDVTGNIITEGGFAVVKFNGGVSLIGSAISECNNGNSFSLCFVGAHLSINTNAGVFNSANISANRVNVYCDRSSGKLAGRIVTASGNYSAELASQLDSGAIRRLYITIDGTTKELKTYLNGTLISTVTFVGTYTNDIFRLGAFRINSAVLNGPLLTFKVASQKWSGADVTSLDAKLVAQYGL